MKNKYLNFLIILIVSIVSIIGLIFFIDFLRLKFPCDLNNEISNINCNPIYSNLLFIILVLFIIIYLVFIIKTTRKGLGLKFLAYPINLMTIITYIIICMFGSIRGESIGEGQLVGWYLIFAFPFICLSILIMFIIGLYQDLNLSSEQKISIQNNNITNEVEKPKYKFKNFKISFLIGIVVGVVGVFVFWFIMGMNINKNVDNIEENMDKIDNINQSIDNNESIKTQIDVLLSEYVDKNNYKFFCDEDYCEIIVLNNNTNIVEIINKLKELNNDYSVKFTDNKQFYNHEFNNRCTYNYFIELNLFYIEDINKYYNFNNNDFISNEIFNDYIESERGQIFNYENPSDYEMILVESVSTSDFVRIIGIGNVNC